MSNPIAEFFSSIAPKWDEMENTPSSFIDALLARCNIKEGDLVLDLGCGTGIITGRIASLSKQVVLGVDVADKMIEIAKKKHEGNPLIEFEVQDFLISDYRQGFDKVIIYNAYPHFLDRTLFIQSLIRALKPDGEFAIIHSCSRQKLESHHKNIESLSRVLLPVEEEASHFLPFFDLLDAEEDEKHYLIRGKLKLNG